MSTEEGAAKAPKATKGGQIETALEALRGAVGDIEGLNHRVSGDAVPPSESKVDKSSRGVGYLLSELPSDLDALTTRLESVRAALEDCLY